MIRAIAWCKAHQAIIGTRPIVSSRPDRWSRGHSCGLDSNKLLGTPAVKMNSSAVDGTWYSPRRMAATTMLDRVTQPRSPSFRCFRVERNTQPCLGLGQS